VLRVDTRLPAAGACIRTAIVQVVENMLHQPARISTARTSSIELKVHKSRQRTLALHPSGLTLPSKGEIDKTW
jgi:hypothetical protein